MGLGDYALSIKMRDTMQKLAEDVVERMRPRDRYGVVQSIDAVNYKCSVLLTGDPVPITVNVGSNFPAAVGQEVRVGGLPGDKIVKDVIGPRMDCPVGSMLMWPTATPPTGWLICDGSTFSAANYPLLNTLLGGNTLPDMRDRNAVGASGTKTVKSTGGAATFTLTTTQLPAHTHTGPSHTHTATTSSDGDHLHQPNISDTTWGFHAYKQGGSIARRQAASGTSFYAISATTMADLDFSEATEQTGLHSHTTTTAASGTAATGSTGTGSAFSIQNPYTALNFIIRAG